MQICESFFVAILVHILHTAKYFLPYFYEKYGNEENNLLPTHSLSVEFMQLLWCVRGMKRHNLIGQTFSKYTVLSFVEVKNSRTMWLCRCECGNEMVVNQNNLTRGVSTSCGCSRKKPKSVAKHRLHGTPIYPIWVDIKRRCENPSRYTWKRYGGIGVKLCEEWQDITMFYAWCLANGWKKGLCVCRKGDVGDYAPDNCYIATKSQNSKDIYIFKKQSA